MLPQKWKKFKIFSHYMTCAAQLIDKTNNSNPNCYHVCCTIFYNSKHVNFCACLLSVMAMNVSRKVFGKLIASFITNVIVMEFYYLYYFIIMFRLSLLLLFSFLSALVPGLP